MRTYLLLPLALLFAPLLRAQSTEDALRARLIHQPLYLRALPREDKLRFSDAGLLLGKADQTSPTLSGVDVYNLRLDKHRLTLEAERVGVKFVAGVPERVTLLHGGGIQAKQETMRIEIAAPASGDYTVPLDAIFAATFAELAPSFPDIWKTFAVKQLGYAIPAQLVDPGNATPAHPSGATNAAPPVRTQPYRVGGGVTAPHVLSMADPEFSEYARVLKYAGNSILNFIVDPNGVPTRIRIVRPIGLGLDEKAVEAAKLYHFAPAMRNGEPVPVEINVSVNFQIF